MYKKIIIILTIALLALPLVVWKFSGYPFVFYKAILLHVCAFGLFVTYSIASNKIVAGERKALYQTPLVWSVLFFFIMISISALQGVDAGRSMWSRPERMTGIYTLFCYLMVYMVWRSSLAFVQWKKLWKYFVGIVGGLVLLVACIQIINPYFLSNLGVGRVVATLGNAVYVASFCSFIFFSDIFFIFTSHKKIGKILWMLEALLSVFVLIESQTRGELIGFVVGLLATCVGVYWFFRKKVTKKIRLGLVSIIGVLIVFFPICYIFRDTATVSMIPVINRIFATRIDNEARPIIWKTAVHGWIEKPWFGWGWENYYTVANRLYEPELLRFGHGEEWVDNAHNVILNILATNGVLGLVAYGAIYISTFYILIQLLKKYKNDSTIFFFAISVGSFFVVHFIRNIFVFEDLSSYLAIFWLYAGIDIVYSTSQSKSIQSATINNVQKIEHSISGWKRAIVHLGKICRGISIGALCIASLYFLYRFTYIPARADYYATKAIITALYDFEKSLDIHRQAIKIDNNPYRPEIAFAYGEFLFSWLHGHPDFAQGEYRPLAEKMYSTAVSALKSFLTSYPDDSRGYFVLGNGFADGYTLWQNQSYVEDAIDVYKKGLIFSPKRQSLHYNLSKSYSNIGEYDSAIEQAEDALQEDSQIGESHWIRALAYYRKGMTRDAAEEVTRAHELGFVISEEDITTAFRILMAEGDPSILEDRVLGYLTGTKNPNKFLLQAYIEYLKSKNKYDKLPYYESMVAM